MSRVDRHEHIGKGCIGLEPFRRLLNDPRFAHLPMILETEKTEWRERGKIDIDPLDEMNLNTLRTPSGTLTRRVGRVLRVRRVARVGKVTRVIRVRWVRRVRFAMPCAGVLRPL